MAKASLSVPGMGRMDADFSWSVGVQDNMSKPLENVSSNSEKFAKKMNKIWSAIGKTLNKANPFQELHKLDEKGRRHDIFTGKFATGSRRRYKLWFSTIKNGFKDMEPKQLKINEEQERNNDLIAEGIENMGLMNDAMEGNVSAIRRLVDGYDRLKTAIAGAAITGMFIAALKSASDYMDVSRKLNSEIKMTAERIAATNEVLDEMVGLNGANRELVQEVLMQGAGYGLLNKNVAAGATEMRIFAKETLTLSKATGESTDSIGEYNFRLAELYDLGWNRLRNFGAAFKYIKDQTRLTNGEIIGLAENSKDLLSLFPDVGQEAKGTMLTGLQAIGGALKDADIDSNALMSTFEEMTRDVRKFGTSRVFSVFATMGSDVESMMGALQRGDFVSVFEEMAKGIQNMSPAMISKMTDSWKEMGLTMDEADLLRIQNLDVGEFRKMVQGMNKEFERGNLAEEAAKNIRRLLFSPWEDFYEFFTNWFSQTGTGTERLLVKLHEISLQITEAAKTFLNSITEERVERFFRTMINPYIPMITKFMTRDFPGWISKLKPYFNKAKGWAMEMWTPTVEAVKKFFMTDLPGWIEAAKPYFTSFKQWLEDQGGIVGIFKTVVGFMGTAVTKIKEWSGSLIDFAKSIADKVTPALDKMVNLVKSAYDSFMAMPKWLQGLIVAGAALAIAGKVASSALPSMNKNAGLPTTGGKLMGGLFATGAALLLGKMLKDKVSGYFGGGGGAAATPETMGYSRGEKTFEMMRKGLKEHQDEQFRLQNKITQLSAPGTAKGSAYLSDMEKYKSQLAREIASKEAMAFGVARDISNPQWRAKFLEEWVGPDWRRHQSAPAVFKDSPEMLSPEGITPGPDRREKPVIPIAGGVPLPEPTFSMEGGDVSDETSHSWLEKIAGLLENMGPEEQASFIRRISTGGGNAAPLVEGG